MLLQQRILPMEGNAVKVHIKGHAVLKVQGLQGVEPAAHELRIRGGGMRQLYSVRKLRFGITLSPANSANP